MNLNRVLIFDLDVHQGDGTATIFKDDEAVYTVSIHCEDNYPFVKSVSNIDVGLKPKTGDDQYMSIMEKTLNDAIFTCRPELVIYDAGVDVSIGDALGRLSLTDNGIYARDFHVLNTCMKMGIPVSAVVLSPFALSHTHFSFSP